MLPRLLGSLLALVILVPATALAQSKPPAQPLPPPPPPAGVNVPAWKAAYEAANRPSIMILVGWSTERRHAPDGATNPEPLAFNEDPGGFAESFRAAIAEHLCPPEADIELVDAAAARAARQRLENTLAVRRENEAVVLLANETDADVIVLVRLYGDMARGVPARVNMIASNSRGRELISYTSNWNTGTDAASILGMGRIFAVEIAEKLSGRFANPQRYTTRVFGLADAESALAMSQCLQDARGVSKVSSRRGQGAGRDAYREYEITTSFEQDMLEVFIGRCVQPMNLVAEMVGLEAGVVNIRVKPRPAPASVAEPSVADCIDAITAKDDPDGNRYRNDLLDLYTRRQQPTFAVLVNRRLSEPERRQLAASGQPVSAENLIVIQAAGAGTNIAAPGAGGGGSGGAAATPGGINAEFDEITELNNLNVTLEGLVYDLLGTEMLNFNRRVDGPTARAKLIELIDAQKKVFREEELSTLLRRANIAQYVIEGTGTIVIENQQLKARYNFRLLDQDGQLVAGAPDIVEEVAFADRSQALRSMARRAVSKMACELREQWRRNNLPTITLKGVADAQDVLNIERAFKEAKLFAFIGNPEIVGIGTEQGVCKFSISHKADITSTQIIEEMTSLGSKIGFDLRLESGDYSRYVFTIKRR